jgi:uncharacterized lipoprotein YmbA
VATSRWPALLIVLGALGCRSVLPRSAKSEFFLLTALEPAPRTATATATSPAPAVADPHILLGPVALPDYLDRPELVTRLASNQLRVDDLELWAEPLRASIARTITQNLTTLLGSDRVQRGPWTRSSPPDLIVSVEVRRFERALGGKVELAARWTIHDGSGQTKRLQRETLLSYAPAPTPSTQTAVAAMSAAVAALSREIATGLRRVAHGQTGGGR